MADRKVILITGGTGLTGKAFCREFISQGKTVITTSRQVYSGNQITELIGSDLDRSNFHLLQINLEADSAASDLINQLNSLALRPDVFIHAARNAEFLGTDDNNDPTREGWLGTLNLDLIVPYEIVMALVCQPDSKLKNVILLSSMYGITPPQPPMYENIEAAVPPPHYGVAKAGVIQLVKELAVRLADRNIRVNTVSSGGVAGRTNSEFNNEYNRRCPAGRMLDVTEIVGAIDFLASPKSSGMTGHNLVVDGGWTIW